MHPVAHEFFSVTPSLCAISPRDVGKILSTAAGNIDLIAQQRGCHCAALDVPAGATTTPGPNPNHLASASSQAFQSAKIANVFLLVLIVANASGGRILQIQMRQFRNRENFLIRSTRLVFGW